MTLICKSAASLTTGRLANRMSRNILLLTSELNETALEGDRRNAKSVRLHLVKQKRLRDGEVLQIRLQGHHSRPILLLGQKPLGCQGGLGPNRPRHHFGAKAHAPERVRENAIQ